MYSTFLSPIVQSLSSLSLTPHNLFDFLTWTIDLWQENRQNKNEKMLLL